MLVVANIQVLDYLPAIVHNRSRIKFADEDLFNSSLQIFSLMFSESVLTVEVTTCWSLKALQLYIGMVATCDITKILRTNFCSTNS